MVKIKRKNESSQVVIKQKKANYNWVTGFLLVVGNFIWKI